ncbi:hypothetical protein F2Q69_00025560 [Brassica cretica]|uniref:Uncharacterized protein n=1 Tax=Brassica cretica TaxID=69181 RepID=A0A8S9S831_BRACR|nr:hypothetical protein F2Q69_00025560 [Brassica cretica]
MSWSGPAVNSAHGGYGVVAGPFYFCITKKNLRRKTKRLKPSSNKSNRKNKTVNEVHFALLYLKREGSVSREYICQLGDLQKPVHVEEKQNPVVSSISDVYDNLLECFKSIFCDPSTTPYFKSTISLITTALSPASPLVYPDFRMCFLVLVTPLSETTKVS